MQQSNKCCGNSTVGRWISNKLRSNGSRYCHCSIYYSAAYKIFFALSNCVILNLTKIMLPEHVVLISFSIQKLRTIMYRVYFVGLSLYYVWNAMFLVLIYLVFMHCPSKYFKSNLNGYVFFIKYTKELHISLYWIVKCTFWVQQVFC